MISFTVLPLTQVPELVPILAKVVAQVLAQILAKAVVQVLAKAVVQVPAKAVVQAPVSDSVLAPEVVPALYLPAVSQVYPSYLLKAASQPLLLRLSLNCLLK